MMVFILQMKISVSADQEILFGIRQSGVLDFKIADVFQDAALLQEANAAAERLLLEDPDLSQEQHRKLKDHLQKKLKDLMLETTL